ncbi:hypothetical protein [Maritimibacter harenae]|uniref:hypothetical protein n=1 Tax=Maritimibacter harenae TaxID=2606218 RepID=UPI0019295C0C|nr:hypothetical protein [Maritimibacter harenae]
MKLFKLAKQFRAEEDGAVTVDWVVLTAAIVGLGIAVLTVRHDDPDALSVRFENQEILT